MSAYNAVERRWFQLAGTTVERLRPHHKRVFAPADVVTGGAGGAEAGAVVTILSDFSSSGLKTNSLSGGVSMACTQTCRLTPMSARERWQRAEIFCAMFISSRGGPLAAERSAAT